jgi:hypothetical protein
MLDVQQKSTGTEYTTTVAFLLVGLVFSPAVLAVTRPIGYVSFAVTSVCSAMCLVLAWLNWKNSSRLTIPSIANHEARAK